MSETSETPEGDLSNDCPQGGNRHDSNRLPHFPGQENTQPPPRRLNQPAQFIKGVGPHRAALLERLGLKTAADILFFFPRTYQDFSEQHNINELSAVQEAAIVGTIDDIDQLITATGKHVLFVLLKQETGYLRAVWYDQPFMLQRFQIGQRVLMRGKAKLEGGRFQMNHPRVIWLENDHSAEQEMQLVPVYRLTEGLNQRQIREIVAGVVADYADLVNEAFPESLRQQYQVCDIGSALRQIHAPQNRAQIDSARHRLVYQELFILQLALAIRRHRVQSQSVSPPLELTSKIKARILGRLPFKLTDSQENAFTEIAHDMGRSFPMNRLLHGEVGSGKTLVAVCSMLLAVANGHQAALMAPTEILATQHYQTLKKILAPTRVRVGLLTGGLNSRQRQQIQNQIAAGEIDLIVGTQAVVSASIEFYRLGLAVIDEQHKFGVKQRALLKQTGHDPHYLVMTATPIPRTITMTLFGDLDISTLDRQESLGKKVHTYLGQSGRRSKWWSFFRKKLDEGRQGFVIAPLVDADRSENETDEEIPLKSGPLGVEQLFTSLTETELNGYRVGLLHGRQGSDSKEETMRQFNTGEIQVLVATGVVEVGIDVPNATVMTIESAERFGLSQLHQLRGRVGRGRHPGFVCVFASSDDPESNQRLTAFADTHDGYELAEIDLQIRGPGNLFGSQQTGFPPLYIADLTQDTEILAKTQQDARQLIATNPLLEGAEYDRLRQLVFARYGAVLEMSDVG